MPRKVEAPKRKDTPAEEYKRFLETAKEVGADESRESFDRAFKKVTKHAPKPKS